MSSTPSRAVVLVSGGAAVTPFTDPDAAARSGLAAGNTLTAIRGHLLDLGVSVFTAPAGIGGGPIESDTGWQGFADVPVVLPAEVTINSAGAVDDGGARLHAFLGWLADTQGLDEVDIVAHSMGGLFSRSAIRIGSAAGGAPRVRRLVTLGTPWAGSLLGDYVAGDIAFEDAQGDAATEQILTGAKRYATERSQGAAEQVSERYLCGADGWNSRQAGTLREVEVTLIAGDHFASAAGPASLWPHDGLVSVRSARADPVPESVLPIRSTHVFPDLHSIYFADLFGLPWERALTWDPAVLRRIADTVATASEPA